MIRHLAALGLAIVIALSACSAGAPELRHDDSVPDDLRALADETWEDFLAAFSGRHDCISSPTLHAAWELETRAEYQPATAVLSVRVPGTPATLRSQLLHEFAHHLEFTCSDHEELRAAFLLAQGFPAEAEWLVGDSWETTPSEHYAEAVVELVEGRRTHQGGIYITDDAIDVVRVWGKGP
ncbi:MAG: hypothetical protein QNJ75_11530 [Acidimicrobiia bacterium]|nr:hypothetical protein [Acidimicrobiia bacterium]